MGPVRLRRRPWRVAVLAGLAAGLFAGSASAELTGVSIASRVTVAGGHAFGAAGAYEKLTGSVSVALDPADPHNRAIVDLPLATRGADGKVHVRADLAVLRPVDPAKGNGSLLFEVANRGNKLLFGYFQGARGRASNDPMALADFGDAFLLREGYTIVWVGWQFDVETDGVGIEAPPVDLRQGPGPDLVRFSFILNASATDAAPADLPRYLPADPDDPSARLTVRDKYWDEPTVLPRGAWRLRAGDTGRPRLVLDSGFEPGRLYEISYRAANAVAAGVGLAALRDTASAFQHRADLPVHGDRAYVFGASQSGRLLRQFLLDGFNVDEQGRRVFALAWPHIAGAGLGSFNERLAMPGYSSFPATRLPFTWPEILGAYAPAERPRVVATNTSVEYWGQGRAAALTHTSLDGGRDLPIPEHVRIYLLAGTQHGEAPFPPPRGQGQQDANPTPQVAVMHALLRAADAWVRQGTLPPPSRYPRLADGSLVPLTSLRFPRLPGVSDPQTVEGPGRLIDGRFTPLPFLVSRVDEDGNETAGIRVPDVAVPLATATGWNFRAPAVGNPGTLFALLGSYVPLPATRAARERAGDPRRAVAERYRDEADYLSRIRAAFDALVRERYLLAEDLESVLARARMHWTHVAGRPAANTARR